MARAAKKTDKQERKAIAQISRQISELHTMTVGQLRERYFDLYGEPTRSRNKDYLRKKVAWRIQELAEGGLSDRALARIEELAHQLPEKWQGRAKRKVTPDRTSINKEAHRDPRLPATGSKIVRIYEGKEVTVQVLDKGFKYRGKQYSSLSRIAREVTGTNWNGFLFFGLQKRAGK